VGLDTKHIGVFGLIALVIWGLAADFSLGYASSFHQELGCQENHHPDTVSGCHYALFHTKANDHERCDHKEHLLIGGESSEIIGLLNQVEKWFIRAEITPITKVLEVQFQIINFQFQRVFKIQNHTTRPPPFA
jgi:hypothetical protein